MKIERLSTMIEGSYCPISIDGAVKHKEVKLSVKGKFIRINKLVLYEDDLPLGKEVEI